MIISLKYLTQCVSFELHKIKYFLSSPLYHMLFLTLIEHQTPREAQMSTE